MAHDLTRIVEQVARAEYEARCESVPGDHPSWEELDPILRHNLSEWVLTTVTKTIETITGPIRVVLPAPDDGDFNPVPQTIWTIPDPVVTYTPIPHAPSTVVASVEELQEYYDNANGAGVALSDARERLWLVWSNGDGDMFATSWPEEDEQYSHVAVDLTWIPFPATVLTAAAQAVTAEREEWADYFERFDSSVGHPRLTGELIAALLRGPRPFGVALSGAHDGGANNG